MIGWLTCCWASDSLRGLVQQLETIENKLVLFLEKFPEYRKTLRLAVTHEESGREARTYQGWQWHDVEAHPTKLIRLVTEGISRISLRTRQATVYLLRDREAVKRALWVETRAGYSSSFRK
jgi:hypothetical protein